MSTTTLEFGGARFTRVLLTDAAVPPSVVGLENAEHGDLPWADETLLDGDQVRVGVGAWVADIEGTRIVLDPFQAADEVLHGAPEAELALQAQIEHLFESAGFPLASIDLVVLTHIDGIGMVARRGEDGAWAPFFPNARVLMSRKELGALKQGLFGAGPEPSLAHEAFQPLLADGLVDHYTDSVPIVGGLVPECSGGHGGGHAVLHFHADGDEMPAFSFIGHLAISPLHLGTGPCETMHEFPARAWMLLKAHAERGRPLVGPLWPSPGVGRWQDERFVAGL